MSRNLGRQYEYEKEREYEKALEDDENMVCGNCARLTSSGECFSCTVLDVVEDGVASPDSDFYCSNFKWREKEYDDV